MARRLMAGLLCGLLVASPGQFARAENQMGYRLVTAEEAAGLPRNHGALGLDAERAQVINDQGLSFELIRVKSVREGAPAARAGLRRGDQIIALDGRVFASLAAFSAYVGAARPGSRMAIDYIPNGGGPAQAQRVTAQMGGAEQAKPAEQGMSTGTKVAIGVGAAALFGCYELGCFSKRNPTPQQPPAVNR